MLLSPANNDFMLLLCRMKQAGFDLGAAKSIFHAKFAFHDLNSFMNCSTHEVSRWMEINEKLQININLLVLSLHIKC